jgi:hypothetical protein
MTVDAREDLSWLIRSIISLSAARVPDRNDERGIRIALDGSFHGLHGNAFTNGAPQGRIVVA